MLKSTSLGPDKVRKLTVSAVRNYKKIKLKEGRKQASTLLTSNWSDPNTFFQIGVAAYNAGDCETSILLYQRALSFNISDKELHSNAFMALGSSLSTVGKFQDAITSFDSALEQNPQNTGALNNRALAYMDMGNTDRALQDFKRAYAQTPSNVGLVLNMGDLLTKTGETVEAQTLYENTLLLQPENTELLHLSGHLKKKEHPMEALVHYRKAMLLAPTNSEYLKSYSGIFQHLPHLQTFEGLENDLLLLLSNENISWNKLNRIVPRHIKAQVAFKEISPALQESIRSNTNLQLDFGKVIKALSNNALLSAIKKMRLVDPEIEKLLELFRRQTLTAVVGGTKIEKPLYDLLRALLVPLAQYCFSSEFVFVETEFETKAIHSLIQFFENGGKGSPEDIKLRYLILSCYRQCHRLSFAQEICDTPLFNKDPELSDLVRSQIKEPLIEFASHASIKKITPINDSISLGVQEQYEENPYPRWQYLNPTGTASYAFHLAKILPILGRKLPDFPPKPKVLIAGCGTGKQPISTARSFPETDLLAIDLSLASISYAMRKAKELKIKNIEFGQADIMELGRLDQKFNIIECGGVLHHMNDPVAGWRVLLDLLEDDGYMLIGLYSEIGRGDVIACRQYIEENGIGNSIEDIRACRKELMALESTHPTKRITKQSDFYTTSACRDLIFHVQEHRFTIPKLEDIFEELNLEFLGFVPDMSRFSDQYREEYPDDKFGTNLKNWNMFEEEHPDTFSTMYKFWVRKKR